ncbi:unnamed protein product, partial [Staurois parvus]
SCWKSAQRPRARSNGSIFFQYRAVHLQIHNTINEMQLLTPAALMQPHRRTLPPRFTVGTMHFSLYSINAIQF